jgi:FXSXX-COOH protein
MIATDDKRSEYPSNLVDLRRVPLADVPAMADRVLDGPLQRTVPDSLGRQVPVAAFNSSI